MSFSVELIEKYKVFLNAKSDAAVASEIPNMTRMNLNAIRKGDRKLTEEQVVHIAERCNLDCAIALVELASECAKSEKAQSVWNSLAKKMKAATSILAVAAFLAVSGLSGHSLPQRVRNSP